MRTYRYNKTKNMLPEINNTYEAIPMETKLKQAIEEKTPVGQISEVYYTMKKDGVLPEGNIRTDIWELGQETMSKVSEHRYVGDVFGNEKTETDANKEVEVSSQQTEIVQQ